MKEHFLHIHRCESGTTLTETVMMMPAFVLVFAGIVGLYQAVVPLAETEVHAYVDTFNQGLEIQQQGLSLVGAKHSVPTIAGGDAVRQVVAHPPRQRGVYQQAVQAFEMNAYTLQGLALSGTFGESSSRVSLVSMTGGRMAGVHEAVGPHANRIIGASEYARRIVDDGPNARFDGDVTVSNAQGPVQTGIAIINGLLELTGAQAALAAGVRYGTVSGHYQQTAGNERFNFPVHSWFTMTVPTYVSSNPWADEMRAASVARLTMTSYYRYNELSGFNGYQDSTGGAYRRAVYDQLPIVVLTPDVLPLWPPLDYDAAYHD